MTAFDVYLMMNLPNIAYFFLVLAMIFIALSILGIIGLIGSLIEESKHLKTFKKTLFFIIPIAFISGALSVLIPDTKTMVMMYALPPVVNDKQVQQLPENLVVYINDFLKKEASN